MRLFIAIELPEEVKDQVLALSQDLASSLADRERALRWVKSDQFHLTLKFLGECAEASVPVIQAALDRMAQAHPRFKLRFNGMAAFSQGTKLKVVWLGADEGASQAEALAKDIEDAFEEIGYPREDRTFHPHLTLARAKVPFPVTAFEKVRSENNWPPIGPVRVEKLSLIESALTPQGPVYTTLHMSPLKLP